MLLRATPGGSVVISVPSNAGSPSTASSNRLRNVEVTAAMADVIDPGLTVVAQDAEELGRRAGALLFSRLSGRKADSVREIVPVSLIRRGSGELAAAE